MAWLTEGFLMGDLQKLFGTNLYRLYESEPVSRSLISDPTPAA